MVGINFRDREDRKIRCLQKFLERLQSYVDLAPALRERVSEIDYVDLRFGERVYVRPAKK